MSRIFPEESNSQEGQGEWIQPSPYYGDDIPAQQPPPPYYGDDLPPPYLANQNRRTPQRNNARQRVQANAPVHNPEPEPELMRAQNGHAFDDFWTDNFLPGVYPSQAEMYMAYCGCSCCMGPCCSDTRKKDWKRLLLTFTFWTMVVELVMLIVEFAIGGITYPSLGPDIITLINLGGKFLPYIYCRGHVFRYITPVILHSGLIHYFFNMLFTYRVMLPREVYWGIIRTVVMYVACGVGGSILSLALYPWVVSVGASGSLCGIFGGYIVDVGRMWKQMSSQAKCMHGVNIVMYLVIMVVLGFTTSNIDNGAHLGGLLTGVFLGMIILQRNLVVRIIGGVCLAITWILPTALLYPLIKIDCSKY